MQRKVAPSRFYPKPQMKGKPVDIYYDFDDSMREFDEHSHDYYEFYFLISGNIQYTIDDHSYSLRKGDVLLIKPTQRHFAAIKSLDKKPYVRYVLWLSPDYLKSMCSPNTNLMLPFEKISGASNHMHISEESQLMISKLLQQMMINIKSEEYGSDILLNALIIELLVSLARIKLYYQPVLPDGSAVTDPLISKALNYISEHITEEIRVEEIADALFVSRSYLSRQFTEFMGISIYSYIVKKKLYLSKQELIGNSMIKDAYLMYGFGDYSSYFRAFKKEFGMSPRQMLNFFRSSEPEGKSVSL